MADNFRWLRALARYLLAGLLIVSIATGWARPAFASGAVVEPIAASSTPSVAQGNALFQANCVGCHARGGNIIRRGKTLKQRALTRNGYDTSEAIAEIVTQGKGAMTAFGDRLTAEEIEAIAQYVLQQAEAGW